VLTLIRINEMRGKQRTCMLQSRTNEAVMKLLLEKGANIKAKNHDAAVTFRIQQLIESSHTNFPKCLEHIFISYGYYSEPYWFGFSYET
jgi:hypothetical protein